MVRKILVICCSLNFAAMLVAQPARPECVAPAKPGGGFDLTCRLAADGLKKSLTKPMKVSFLPGGVGAVAYSQFATRRRRDNNAIVAFSSGSLLNIATGKFGQFDEKAVRFLAAAGTDYGAYVVRSDRPYQKLADVVAMLRKDAESIVFGAGGSVGSQDWMKVALLFDDIGVDTAKMRYVSFEGGGEALTNLLGGSIDFYAGDVAELESHKGSSELTILAVLAKERVSGSFNHVPTAAEQGYNVVWPIVRGYYMGKDTSDAAYQFYAKAFRDSYRDPEFQQMRQAKGLFPLEMVADEFDAYAKGKIDEMRTLAIRTGIIEKEG